MITDLTTTVMG